jgi:8-oxo-dGTP pyrophosphatase MutT (NUDIX family)
MAMEVSTSEEFSMAKETEQRVFVAFITHANNVVVIRRSMSTNNGGQIGLIGGHIDEGESLEQAAHREVLEEVNVDFDFSSASYVKKIADKHRTILVTPLPFSNTWDFRPNPDEVESIMEMSIIDVIRLDDGAKHKSLRLAQDVLIELGINYLYSTLSPE